MGIQAFQDLSPEAGGMARGWVEVPGVEPAWQLPVVVVRGAHPGPTLAITAGVHACEYAPMEAVRRFVLEVDRSALHGTVIAILQVNTPGFYSRTVFLNPRDGKNINRVFPGLADGTAAERVAAFLMRELAAKADAFVDCHCGDMVEALIPFSLWTRTGDPECDSVSQRMATAYSDSMVFGGPLQANRGMAFAEVAALGIPAMLGEAGQQGVVAGEAVEAHLRGLRGVLGVLGMAPAPPLRPAPQVMGDEIWLSASNSGFFHPEVQIGDQVATGQKVGEVRDVFGVPLEEVVAPQSGVVFVMLTGLAVTAGEALLAIGVP